MNSSFNIAYRESQKTQNTVISLVFNVFIVKVSYSFKVFGKIPSRLTSLIFFGTRSVRKRYLQFAKHSCKVSNKFSFQKIFFSVKKGLMLLHNNLS